MPPALKPVHNNDPVLQDFEGKPEESTKLEVTKTGHGLEKSLEIAPVRLEIGDKAGVLILGEVTKIRHEPHKYEKGEEDIGGVDRVQILEAEGAIVLPADSPELAQVRAVISKIQEREKARRDAARGQLTMAVDNGPAGEGDQEDQDPDEAGD